MKNKTQLTLILLFAILSAFALVTWIAGGSQHKKASAGNFSDKTVGEIVASDIRTAEVFKDAGIDFCCGGELTLAEACRRKGIRPEVLEEKLKAAEKEPASVHNYNDWNAAFLSEFIVNTHHRFLMETLPQARESLGLTVTAHGANHNELYKIKDLFAQVEQELLLHLEQEEQVLFPAIKTLQENPDDKTAQNQLAGLKSAVDDHVAAGSMLDEINRLTNGYKVPSDGCNTYRHTYNLLKNLEHDLHVHIHLENNILFPKAERLAGLAPSES